MLTWLAMTPAFAFIRQRSGFILGWRAAAAAGAALASGESAGAVGSLDRPALGSWMMLPDLTTPATRTVLPMNDSLYGASHLELDRQGPMVLAVPADDSGRYFSVGVMDGHFCNVAHLGPRWTGAGAFEALLVPPGWEGVAPDGMRVIESPTASVCLLHRALVDYEPGDIERVRAWRDGFDIRPLHGPLVEVETSDLVHPDGATLADPWRFFEIGRDHLRRNPLPDPAHWALHLADTDELLDARSDPALAAAVEEGVAAAQAMVDECLTAWPRDNGWMLPRPWIGRPNPHVLETAALALFQVGSNDLGEAAYFFGDLDSEGQPLDGAGGSVYRLSFSADRQPPVRPEGFWSVTMYGPDSLLVTNAIDRYSTRVSRPGFVRDPDGATTITLASRLPDGVPEANWLPAPEGPFRLGLRLYYPGGDVAEGTWIPAAPRRVS